MVPVPRGPEVVRIPRGPESRRRHGALTTYDVSGDGTKIVIGAHDKYFYTPSNPESGYFFTYLFEYNPATHQS
eukprot:6909336-Pyramimonas_sp.AAC.1